MKILKKIIKKIICRIKVMLGYVESYPNITNSSSIHPSTIVYNKNNIYLDKNASISDRSIIMNSRAKFIMKKNSGAAFGLVVVTGNHMSIVGKNFKQVTDKDKDELDINSKMDEDIIVEEDVWIGNHVTLLSGVKIGRGSIIGAGSVVRRNIPPYSMVIGNPAKVIGFRFNPEEIIEHEKVQYQENERLSVETINKNYEKYFLNRIKEIKQYTSV